MCKCAHRQLNTIWDASAVKCMIPAYNCTQTCNTVLKTAKQMQVNCWDNLINTEDEAEIVFTYLGKKNNFTSAALSQDRTLTMNNNQICEHPVGTQFYVILKPNIDISHGAARSTSDGQEQNQYRIT